MATLAEILALLNDNDTGDITAARMRQVITDVWGLSVGDSLTQALKFDTAAPDPAFSPGHMHWNTTDQTLNVDSEFTGTTLQLGQEQWVRVRNTTGATIPNGRPVRITGATGQIPLIALDDGQGELAGVATMDIANNSFGLITTLGLVRDFNTSAFSDGADVYSTATGTLTTAITGSFVGIIALAHPTQGVLLISRLHQHRPTGTTAQRPTVRATGYEYFDQTLGLPIWWNGAAWINASGGVV